MHAGISIQIEYFFWVWVYLWIWCLPKLYFFNFKFTRQGHLLCTPAFPFKLNTFLIKSFLVAKFGFIGGYGVLPKLYFPNFKITRQQRFLSFQQEPFLDLDVLFGKLKDIKPRQQSVEWWSLHSPYIWQRRPPRNIGRPIPIFCWSTLTPDHICPTNCDKSHTYFHYSVPFWHQIKFVAKDKSYNISQKHVYVWISFYAVAVSAVVLSIHDLECTNQDRQWFYNRYSN